METSLLISNEIRRANKLRKNIKVKIYKVNSQNVFPIRALDGSLTPLNISYLIWYTKRDYKHCYKYGFEFDSSVDRKKLREIVKKAYNTFQIELKTMKASKLNLDGGDLGRAN